MQARRFGPPSPKADAPASACEAPPGAEGRDPQRRFGILTDPSRASSARPSDRNTTERPQHHRASRLLVAAVMQDGGHLRDDRAKRLTTMADAVFFLIVELGRGRLIALGGKQRIVAEAVIASFSTQDTTRHAAGFGDLGAVRRAKRHDARELGAAALIGSISELVQKQGIIGRVPAARPAR